ncbi:MAG: hypothetical protein ABI647_11245, partial [Gemmatimonadota bacterium]
MGTLREDFPPPIRPFDRASLLAEDLVFRPSEFPELARFRLEHEQVSLLEAPLTVHRRYALTDTEDPDLQLRLDLRLCLEGPAGAFESLYRFTESFQRPIPREALKTVKDLGDLAFAWSWDEPLASEVVAFVRHNVMVAIRGADAGARPERVARDIDARLRTLPLTDRYDSEPGPLSALEAPKSVGRGARLTLAANRDSEERWFFLTTAGSVNRDPKDPELWYYRAGLASGL